ncbi:AAA family ATPase [Asticcacaulis sp. AND118]|uniref:AAA family ATPase n=1 Tax=Asticcacaulis sp. AND118 TaxID=2840468 RepID=UPI001CFF7293|nr:ATP-binding protein [Asticcacaulis sp. AND118]UDF05613.1 ATP-binding protein [Asticcacaulis sp. AND118]
MSSAKQILALLQSHAEGDQEQFYSIALQVAAAEARQGHRSTADALRSAVESAQAATPKGPVAIQFSKPRGELEGLISHRDARYGLKDVVVDARLRTSLDELVQEQHRRNWLREHGRVPNRRILFVGPPGSGKTMTAEAVAGQLGLPLFIIRLETLITRFMGETAAKLRLIFDEVSKRRGVYLFDEFDAVGGRRDASNDVAEMRRVLNSFLQYMEEEASTDSVIIGATNHPELLDKALLRRFDAVLAFGLPTQDEVKKIVQSAVRPFKIKAIAWTKVLDASAGLSQAEIAKAAGDAVKFAILNERDSITSDQLVQRLQARRDMQEAFTHRTAG